MGLTKKLLPPLALSVVLAGCGGGGSSSSTGSTVKGTLIDNTISGVKYVNGGAIGFTDGNGQFPYSGGLAQFFVGDVKIGEITSMPNDKRVFIQDIVGVERTNTSNPDVIKIATFLQTLDSNPATDEIEIVDADFDKFESEDDSKADILDDSFDVNSELTEEGFTPKTEEEVVEHLKNTIVEEEVDTEAPVLSMSNETYTTTVGEALELQTVTATDNVDSSVSVVQGGDTVDFDTAGSYEVTYTATDASGNASSITHTYVVNAAADTTAPVLSSTTQSFTTTEGTPLTLETVTATDDVDGTVSVVQGGDTVDFDTVGSYAVTYTATDAAGNTSIITHTYVVNEATVVVPVDTTAPVLSSTTQTFTTTAGTPLTLATVTATDAVDGTVSVVQGGATVDFNTVGSYAVTYTATDAAGNTSTITHTYVVNAVPDTTAPVLSSTTQTFTTSVGTPLTLETVTANDVVDGSVAVVQGGDSVNFNTPGSYAVTYTATDAAGNVSTITHTYVVSDTTAPVLSSTTQTFTTPAGTPLTLETVTATDNVDGTVSVVQAGDTVDFNTAGSYAVTYTATDAAGNVSTITHTYDVTDATAPVLSSTSQTFTTPEGTPLTLETVTATDDVDGTVAVVQSGDTVDFNTPGSYAVTYTATDSEGNDNSITHTYVVTDATAPVLSSTTQTFTTTAGTPLTLETVTATDNVDGTVSVVQAGDTVDFNTAGTYVVTYTATDVAGNPSTITHTYVVNAAPDTTAPVLSMGDETYTTPEGTPLTLQTVTATDDVDGSVAVVQGGDTVDFNTVGSYAVTYTATDAAGNSDIITHTYNVTDAIAPVLSMGDETYTTTEGSSLTLQTVTATDAVDGSVAVVQGGDTVDFNTVGSYAVTYTATDAAGNASTITHTYVVNSSATSVTHDGITYNIVTSPATGKEWLDRNLGATAVCDESRDSGSFADDDAYSADQSACFGDYYQWGRLTDGHEALAAVRGTTTATDITSAGTDFIATATAPFEWVQTTTVNSNNVDDNGTLRMIQWAKTDGTSICPTGFRVPTKVELGDETIDIAGGDEPSGNVKVTNRDTAFKNFLKLPTTGYKDRFSAAITGEAFGIYWTNEVSGTQSTTLQFNETTTTQNNTYDRAVGFPVRCIKDANVNPTAAAGADQTVVSGDTVTFDASSSTDSDGSISAYQWLENGVELSTAASFTKSDLTVGTHTITLIVTDDSGAKAFDQMQVVVQAPAETVSHDGITYEVVTSPITGKKWLDRNLGATAVCDESRDSGSFADDAAYTTDQSACFGDLYQWGRLTDGHEDSASASTTTKASDIASAGTDFITNAGSEWLDTGIDDDAALRMIQWSKTDGSSICPTGYRVPSKTELGAETIDYVGADNLATGAVKITNRDTAFKNFLKFPTTGIRNHFDASVGSEGSFSIVWTNGVDATKSTTLEFGGSASQNNTYNRTYGFPVRCIEDANANPTAAAGSDQTVVSGDSVTLDASSSTDDGSIASYQWKEGTTELSTSASFSTSALSVGTHTITLIVTDNAGLQAYDQVEITVNAAPETVTHDGITYNVITSPATGKQWLDRNLGATVVCTKSRGMTETDFDGSTYADEATADAAYVADQEACFGDFYQWGRIADGHEDKASATTATKATDLASAGTDFITTNVSPQEWLDAGIDEDGTLRVIQWAETDGTSICPTGFRIPTKVELGNETVDIAGGDPASGNVKVINRDTAFQNFLKLPTTGWRNHSSAAMQFQGDTSIIWTNGASGTEEATTLEFGTSTSQNNVYRRTYGFPVRCIKDTNLNPTANAGGDKTAQTGDPITFDAALSSDSDGSIASYQWLLDGSVLSTAASFVKSDLAVGTHTITLIVTDDSGAKAYDQIEVTVNVF